MPNFPDFSPGLAATAAHGSLVQSVKMMNQAQHCAVLWFGEIMSRRLYRELGYSTMRAYALEELGFSPTRAGDFIRLAQKLDSLPIVKAKISSGDLGYTQAREIIKVADTTNEREWVDVAQSHSRRELEVVVQIAKQKARAAQSRQVSMLPPVAPLTAPTTAPTTPPSAIVPVRVGFELTPAQNARYEAMLAKIDHRGNKADLLLAMVESLLGDQKIAPRGATSPRYQVHIHQCPTCESSAITTPKGELRLSKTEAEEVSCDAMIHVEGRRNKSTIAPKTRRDVLARDRHRCRRKGCDHTRHLDLHHLVPRAQGGSNGRDNLVTLCTTCHHLWHEKGGEMQEMLRPVEL